MRGRFCEVKNVGERGEKHLILAQISDYNETSDEFVNGEFKGRPRVPSRALVFAYNADKGALDVSTQGFGRVGEKFHEAYCRCILGMAELPKQKQAPEYYLRQLLKSPPEFVYAPSEAVKSCAIVGMQLRDCRLGKIVWRIITSSAKPEKRIVAHKASIIEIVKITIEGAHEPLSSSYP